MSKFMFFIILILLCYPILGQEVESKKNVTPIYADAIITVTTKAGTVKELIAEIGLQNKGVPAIDANQLALACHIPAINANSVRMGIFLMALHDYFDDATETQLSVKTDIQVVYIKGKKVNAKNTNDTSKIIEEFNLLIFPKNASLTEMIATNVLDEIIKKVKTQYEIKLLSYHEEKMEKTIYFYGSQVNIRILERLLNKIEKKWQLEKDLKFTDILKVAILEEKMDSIEAKISELETTTEVYTLHKNKAIENLTTKDNQKDLLIEIENLKKQIAGNQDRIKKLMAELEKLKKQKDEK